PAFLTVVGTKTQQLGACALTDQAAQSDINTAPVDQRRPLETYQAGQSLAFDLPAHPLAFVGQAGFFRGGSIEADQKALMDRNCFRIPGGATRQGRSQPSKDGIIGESQCAT